MFIQSSFFNRILVYIFMVISCVLYTFQWRLLVLCCFVARLYTVNSRAEWLFVFQQIG